MKITITLPPPLYTTLDGKPLFAGASPMSMDELLSRAAGLPYDADAAAQNFDESRFDTYGSTWASALPDPMTFQSIGIRLNTTVSADPRLTLEEALEKRETALMEYLNNNGYTSTSFRQYTDTGIFFGVPSSSTKYNGLLIDLNDNARFVSWGELGIENPIKMLDDGYQFVDSKIFGEMIIEGGNNPTQQAIESVKAQERAMSDEWFAVNGPAPEFNRKPYYMQPNHSSKNADSIDFFAVLCLGKDSYSNTTDLAGIIDNYIKQYNSILDKKMSDIAAHTEYYSDEEILKRAEKAGYTDIDMQEKILKAQKEYGEFLINEIKSSGSFRIGPDESLEKALAEYLSSDELVCGIADIFGGDRSETARDIASARLGGGNQIRVGESSFSYEEYMDISDKINSICDDLCKSLFTARATINNTHEDIFNLMAKQMKEINEMGSKYGDEFLTTLQDWYENTQDKYIASINKRNAYYYQHIGYGTPPIARDACPSFDRMA